MLAKQLPTIFLTIFIDNFFKMLPQFFPQYITVNSAYKKNRKLGWDSLLIIFVLFGYIILLFIKIYREKKTLLNSHNWWWWTLFKIVSFQHLFHNSSNSALLKIFSFQLCWPFQNSINKNTSHPWCWAQVFLITVGYGLYESYTNLQSLCILH